MSLLYEWDFGVLSLPYGWGFDFEDADVGFVLFELGAGCADFDFFQLAVFGGVVFYAPGDEQGLFWCWVEG